MRDDRFAAACFWFAIICAINPAVPFLSLFIVKIIELFMLHEYSGLPSRSDGTAETKLWASLARLEIGTISPSHTCWFQKHFFRGIQVNFTNMHLVLHIIH